MELADFVSIGNQDPALRFLIIGGWAVAAHGHTRSTFDVDFLTRQADREAWLTRLTSSGLNLLHESESFAQFTQKAGDGLDLMFVNDATFTPMWDASEERRFVNAQARVPCLDHLLALKLHDLRQRLPTLVSLEHMQHRIRQLRACFPDGIPTAEERWRAKSDEPFRL